MKIIVKKDGTEITNLEEWKCYASPKDAQKHWKDGRSAKEMARFVLSKDFASIMSSIFAEIGLNEETYLCEPEAKTYFGKGFGRGGPRNHDLIMVGNESVVGIEAKVSESFDELVSKKSTKRVNALMEFLYGVNEASVEDKNELYYQLITATVGTIKEAKLKGKKKAIVLFITFTGNVNKEKSYEANIKRNKKALEYFYKKIKINNNGKLNNLPGSDDDIECWIKSVIIHINSNYNLDK